MSQNPIPTGPFAKSPSGVFDPLHSDAQGSQLTTSGGVSTALNQTAAAALKASAGRVAKVIIIAPGSTSGAFTLNDATTTGGASAANTIWSLPYNSTLNVAGQVFDLQVPCANGIVLSAVPGGGSPIIAISYT